jgi:hypothetical protein
VSRSNSPRCGSRSMVIEAGHQPCPVVIASAPFTWTNSTLDPCAISSVTRPVLMSRPR